MSCTVIDMTLWLSLRARRLARHRSAIPCKLRSCGKLLTGSTAMPCAAGGRGGVLARQVAQVAGHQVLRARARDQFISL